MALTSIQIFRSFSGHAVKVIMLLALGAAMASCRTTGDFGRQKPSYFLDHVVPSVKSKVSTLSGVDASAYPLTSSEEELRARSVAIIENEGPSAARTLDQIGVNLGVIEGSYQRERRVEHSSGTPDLERDRYPRHPNILLSAVSEDLDLLRGFASVATIVYAQDKKRLRSLRKGGDVPADDVLDTTGRVQENRGIVENTILALHNRIDDYEVELRRSVLVHPDSEKAQVENAIGRLANRMRRFEKRIRALSDPKGSKHHDGLLG